MMSFYEPSQITAMAKRHGYRLEQHQKNIGLLIYVKPGVQVNVWTTKMTVATCLEHPHHGKTQLFRRHVDLDMLARIFENPRVHTMRRDMSHGYHTRRGR